MAEFFHFLILVGSHSLSIGCVIFHTPFLIVLFSKVFRDDRNGASAWKKVKKLNVGYSSPVSFVCFRAWIPLKNIWELNNKPPTKKRSKALVQAEEELKIYLRILNAMGDEQVSLQYNTCGNFTRVFYVLKIEFFYHLGQIKSNLVNVEFNHFIMNFSAGLFFYLVCF